MLCDKYGLLNVDTVHKVLSIVCFSSSKSENNTQY